MRCLLALAALVLAVTSVHAQRSLPERIEDLRQTAAVRAALAQDAQTRAYDVNVTTESGVVTLGGTVPTLSVRERAEVLAGEVGGVRVVVNGLRLTGQAEVEAEEVRPPPRYEDNEAEPEVAAPEPEHVEPTPEVPAEAQPVHHTVRSGDTLYSVARRYGTTVSAVQRLNSLPSTDIRVGQRLRVR